VLSTAFGPVSLTKAYVATVVLQLAGEGKLSLGDTVERWLPGLVPASDRITIRQLRNHSSGVPEFDQEPRILKPYLAGNLHYHWSPQALVRIAVSHKRQFAPGRAVRVLEHGLTSESLSWRHVGRVRRCRA